MSNLQQLPYRNRRRVCLKGRPQGQYIAEPFVNEAFLLSYFILRSLDYDRKQKRVCRCQGSAKEERGGKVDEIMHHDAELHHDAMP